MFKPLARALGNNQKQQQQHPKNQPKPNQPNKQNRREDENSNDCEDRFPSRNLDF